jgi:hypothetical protein
MAPLRAAESDGGQAHAQLSGEAMLCTGPVEALKVGVKGAHILLEVCKALKQ